jgi:CRP/FNR family transcriptional regulator
MDLPDAKNRMTCRGGDPVKVDCCDFFQHERASDSIGDVFRKYGTLVLMKKNSFIYMRGDPAFSSFYIESGFLKVCGFTDLGQEMTFYIRKKGEFFGVAEIILNEKRQSSAQCLSDCQIWVVNSVVIREKLLTDITTSSIILNTITRRLIHQQKMVEYLITKSASWRLAWVLTQLCVPAGDGTYMIDMKLTQEELSKIIGCSRQTVSEMLNHWRDNNIIEYNRHKIVIRSIDKLLDEPD